MLNRALLILVLRLPVHHRLDHGLEIVVTVRRRLRLGFVRALRRGLRQSIGVLPLAALVAHALECLFDLVREWHTQGVGIFQDGERLIGDVVAEARTLEDHGRVAHGAIQQCRQQDDGHDKALFRQADKAHLGRQAAALGLRGSAAGRDHAAGDVVGRHDCHQDGVHLCPLSKQAQHRARDAGQQLYDFVPTHLIDLLMGWSQRG